MSLPTSPTNAARRPGDEPGRRVRSCRPPRPSTRPAAPGLRQQRAQPPQLVRPQPPQLRPVQLADRAGQLGHGPGGPFRWGTPARCGGPPRTAGVRPGPAAPAGPPGGSRPGRGPPAGPRSPGSPTREMPAPPPPSSRHRPATASAPHRIRRQLYSGCESPFDLNSSSNRRASTSAVRTTFRYASSSGLSNGHRLPRSAANPVGAAHPVFGPRPAGGDSGGRTGADTAR